MTPIFKHRQPWALAVGMAIVTQLAIIPVSQAQNNYPITDPYSGNTVGAPIPRNPLNPPAVNQVSDQPDAGQSASLQSGEPSIPAANNPEKLNQGPITSGQEYQQLQNGVVVNQAATPTEGTSEAQVGVSPSGGMYPIWTGTVIENGSSSDSAASVNPAPQQGVVGAAADTSTEPFTGHVEKSLNLETVAVPADTVIQISLEAPMSSKDVEVGKDVTAVVKEPVFVGPYLLIPAGSTIAGKVKDVNRKRVKDGPNPYIMVEFDRLHRPDEAVNLPFSGSLIAYKTGLRRSDYVWKLPQKGDRRRATISSAFDWALMATMVNPFIGPVAGAAAGALKAALIHKVASNGTVKIKEKDQLPIAVRQPVPLPVRAVWKDGQLVEVPNNPLLVKEVQVPVENKEPAQLSNQI